MWLVLFISLIALGAAGAVYVVCRFHRFPFVARLAGKSRLLSWLVSLVPLLVPLCFWLINVYSVVVVLLHLLLFWILCDLAFWIARRIGRKPASARRTAAAGCAAMALTAIYLGIGWYCAHHVWVTSYTLETDKDLGGAPLRIVEIADAHLGITLDGADFAAQMERVAALSPDAVVLVGDFVDDDSRRTDMLEAAAALGRLRTACGVYFVYGNHDPGYFRGRDFSDTELRAALTENGVVILEDERVTVGGRFTLVGRKDRSNRTHAAMADLAAGLDSSLYTVVLDHQPNDYAAEAASGVDLVLSGHTHGGHVFPAGPIGLAMGANDRIWGMETRGATTFIVTSGISGWAIPFKTGTHSEFVVIDITER